MVNASFPQLINKLSKMPKSAKKLTKMENHSSDDEEDALEMERNFALLSKRSAMQTSAEDEEKMRDEDDGSAEDDEAPDEDESAEVEDIGMDDEGDTGSEDEESVSDHEDGGSQAQSHRKGSIKSGKKISDLSATVLSFKLSFADPV